MKINIEEALKFLDNPSNLEDGQPSAVISVIGEDLNTFAFKHYLEDEKNAIVTILNDPKNGNPISVTQGKKKGKRLDRWILVEIDNKKFLYQCEIKNWAAKAIGGKRLPLNSNIESVQKITKNNWGRQLDTEFSSGEFPNGVTKVLVKMKTPKGYEDIKDVKTLLIYWMPISNSDSLNYFFQVDTSTLINPKIKTIFSKLNIFSASLYLRKLRSEGIEYIPCENSIMNKTLKNLNKICEE
jgi:hypothetical protein